MRSHSREPSPLGHLQPQPQPRARRHRPSLPQAACLLPDTNTTISNCSTPKHAHLPTRTAPYALTSNRRTFRYSDSSLQEIFCKERVTMVPSHTITDHTHRQFQRCLAVQLELLGQGMDGSVLIVHLVFLVPFPFCF